MKKQKVHLSYIRYSMYYFYGYILWSVNSFFFLYPPASLPSLKVFCGSVMATNEESPREDCTEFLLLMDDCTDCRGADRA